MTPDTAIAGEQSPDERAPRAAYLACQDSIAATLPDPENALWGELPDNVQPTGEPGRYAVLAQVRPDSLSPGVSYACVVEQTGGGWRVISLQAQPSSSPGAPG